MARNRYTTENRQALKALIVAADGWNAYRMAALGGRHSGTLTLDDIEAAADALGIDCDAFALGAAAGAPSTETTEEPADMKTAELDPVTLAVQTVMAGDFMGIPDRVRVLAEKAEAVGIRVDAEKSRADAEAKRADRAEAEVKALRVRAVSVSVSGDDTEAEPEAPAPVALPPLLASKAFGIRSLPGEVVPYDYPLAPPRDPGYIFDREALLTALAFIQSPTGWPMLWLGGPAGVGKTSFARELAAVLGRPFFRINHTRDTEAAALLGLTAPHKGSTRWIDGPLTKAVRMPGAVICLDEPSIAPPGVMALYHSLLEPNGMGSLVLESGERVPLGRDSIVVACDNSTGWGDDSGRFAAVQQMNAAFMDRFGAVISLGWLDRAKESAMIAARSHAPRGLCERLVAFAHLTREQADKGIISGPIGPRRLIACAKAMAMGLHPDRAIPSTILAHSSPEDAEVIAQLANAGLPSADVLLALAQGMAVDEADGNPAPASTIEGARAQADFA